MKRLSIFFAALIVSVSSIFAAEEVYKTALFGKDYNSKGVNAYDATWSSTNEGFTVNIANFNNNNNDWNYIRCGRKKVDSKATITTATAIDIAITKIVVTVDAVTTANVNSTTLTVASDNAFTKDVQTITVAAAKGELAYKVTAPAENMYYKLTFDCKSGSNGIMQISKVEYYKTTADIPATAIALDQTTLELEQYKYIPLVATLTPADATTTVVWTSSNEKVATVNEQGVVSALTVGSATITATAGELTATCAVTVSKEATPITCAQAVEIAKTVSANNEIAAGGKYVIRGYVTEIASEDATTDMAKYGNYSVWMADTKDGGKVFEAFRVVPTDGKTIAAVGDYVEVIGDITVYNGTFETVGKTGTIEVMPQYTIMVDCEETMGSIACGEDEAFEIGEFLAGTEVTLTATANEGYEFVNWTFGTETKTENPLTITVSADMAMTANFQAKAVAKIEWELNGGEVKATVPTNEELWEAFKPYYNKFYGLSRADQPIDKVSTFASAKMQEIMTGTESEYKWLGDYVAAIATEQGYTLDGESPWRWTVHAFFNCSPANSLTVKVAGFDVAGKPEAWGKAYQAATVVTLPETVSEEYTLPIPVKTGATFLGWFDNEACDGTALTSIPAGWTGTLYASWKETTPTSIDNATIATKAEKIVRNGQVLIIRDGKTYNVMGQVAE